MKKPVWELWKGSIRLSTDPIGPLFVRFEIGENHPTGTWPPVFNCFPLLTGRFPYDHDG